MLRIHKAPIGAGALFILFFPLVAERLPAIENYTDLMVFAGIYCLITIGLSLLMGYAGQISLGHAAFVGIGAYVSGILTSQYGLNPWLCMLLGAAVAALIALAVGAPALKLRGHYLAHHQYRLQRRSGMDRWTGWHGRDTRIRTVWLFI